MHGILILCCSQCFQNDNQYRPALEAIENYGMQKAFKISNRHLQTSSQAQLAQALAWRCVASRVFDRAQKPKGDKYCSNTPDTPEYIRAKTRLILIPFAYLACGSAASIPMHSLWHSRKGSLLTHSSMLSLSQTFRAQRLPQPMHCSVLPGKYLEHLAQPLTASSPKPSYLAQTSESLAAAGAAFSA